ncbi:hypothetical protein [Allomuricauda sp. M10]|uniref:hypothetical protein n=1 Tax=Allomuricauda sp. M10 TaxID=2683292 RepID=UPI001D17E352|nr:hypothetical protein [Muricauda sp. M10]
MPKILDLKQPLKKILQFGVAGLILFLNIINIYNAWKDNSDLIETAKNSLKTIESAAVQIGKVDSVLGDVKTDIEGQVDLLDEAIGKSKELIRLDSLDFESKRAEMTFGDLRIVDYDQDSSKVRIQGKYLNSGRKATLLYSDVIFFLTDESWKNLAIFLNDSAIDDNLTSFQIANGIGFTVHTGAFDKNLLSQNNKKLVLVTAIIYRDDVTKKIYREQTYDILDMPKNGMNMFAKQSPSQIKSTNQVLKSQNLYNKIYPPEYY